MTTAQIWIEETRDLLLTSYVEELLVLGASVDSGDTQLTITDATDSGIVPGVIIEIDSEAMYVQKVGGTIDVIRAYGASEAAAHDNLSIVRVSPKFPTYRILEALNNDLRDLSAPDNGIFQIKMFTTTYNVAKQGYDLTEDDVSLTNEAVQSIYAVSYTDPITVEAREPEIRKWGLKRNRITTSFASGMALVLYQPAFPGKKINVSYKSPLTLITGAASSFNKSSTGLQSTAYDLPPLGAALALMAGAPIRREFIDAQGSSRRAEEVPPGAISGSMRDLRFRRETRVAAEAARLSAMYPQQLKS
tara:strand:+ start:24766 stop:25677 length:912 start_codon:yes stop_codon:yes gene_type:complete